MSRGSYAYALIFLHLLPFGTSFFCLCFFTPHCWVLDLNLWSEREAWEKGPCQGLSTLMRMRRGRRTVLWCASSLEEVGNGKAQRSCPSRACSPGPRGREESQRAHWPSYRATRRDWTKQKWREKREWQDQRFFLQAIPTDRVQIDRFCKYISKLRKTDLPENSPSDSKRRCKRQIS